MIVGMIPALSTIPPAHAQDEVCDTYPMCVFLHPGVADNDKPGFSHTLDTIWGAQNGAVQQRQVFDHYLDYAVLASAMGTTSSVGDLQFDLTVLDTLQDPQGPLSGIEIWIPPEFKFTAPTPDESVWTDLTNDNYLIYITTATHYDPIAPDWTRVMIGLGYWGDGPTPASQIGAPIPPKIDPTTGEIVPYHVRLFNLAAPDVAGLYHFKIYYYMGTLDNDLDNPLYWNNYHSLGAGNFPIMIVKSELNPAWVEATVRTELYFNPPLVSGYVMAEGTTPEGRDVKAMAYWGPNEFAGNVFTPDLYGNGGAEYRVWLFGLAEGTYQLTAYATGMVPKTSDRFSVLAGQSYHAYMTVFDSPDIFTTIFSKHGTGELPWHNLWQYPFGTNDPYAAPCDDYSAECPRRDLMVELYDSNNALVAFWASNDQVTASGSHALRGNPIYSTESGRKWFGWANRLDDAHSHIAVGSATVWPLDVDPDSPAYPVEPAAALWDSQWVYAPVYSHPIFTSSPLVPSTSSVTLHLVDNYDLLLQTRGYPGTQWDGHVPWDTADYVNGILNGQYTLETFVTGYVMDQPDAYQRTFMVSGIDKTVPLDLRRSNWIEVSMHVPSSITVSQYASTTVVLTAEDANGGERAAAAFYLINPNQIKDGVIGPIVLEGKNGIFPNIGSSVLRGTGTAREPTEKDYGLDPTASSHSAGAVSLAGNPYTIKLYMADMGQPWAGEIGSGWYNIVGGDPQTSIFLCNSATTVSFTIRPAWLELFLRSVDFEVPAHARPWTFPGSEIWVDFMDESGNSVDTLDPTIYGLVQDAGESYGFGGFDIVGVDYTTPEGQQVGRGVTPYDYDSSVPACPLSVTSDLSQTCAGRHSLLKVTYAGTDWTSEAAVGSFPLYRALPAGSTLRPTRLPAGQYTIDVHTHGYVLRRAFPVMVPAEQGADIQADLIQGGQIRVVMSFKHEGIKTLFKGFVRVEVFNEAGDLVGASVYGRAEPNTFTDNIDGGGYFALHDPQWYYVDQFYPWQMRYGWDDTTHSFMYPGSTYDPGNDVSGAAGFGLTDGAPDSSVLDSVFPSTSVGQRAMWSNLYYAVPYCPDELDTGACQVWATWDYVTPINGNEWIGGGYSGGVGTDTVVVDVYGFYWYAGDPARTWAGGWPTTNGYSNSGPQVSGWTGLAWDSGIRGSADIPNWAGSGGGSYSVKIWAFDYDPTGGIAYGNPTWAPRMYAMGWPLEGITLPWGGAEDLYVDMNSLATLQGTVSWLDMYGTYRYLPWAQIMASPGPGDDTNAYGTPGYVMWVPAGQHDVSVSTSEAPGVWGGPAEQNGQFTVLLTDGSTGGGETRLDHTEGVPVPELPVYVLPFGLLAVLGAAVWLLRKQNPNTNTPVLMK
jgi:hypothetical protein